MRALQPLSGAVTIERIREANRRTIESGSDSAASPESAARWLMQEIGTPR